MNRKSPICSLNLSAVEIATVPVADSTARRRLARGFARLQNIDLVRNHRGDASFGKWAENRIVWRELLELELQGFGAEDDTPGRRS